MLLRAQNSAWWKTALTQGVDLAITPRNTRFLSKTANVHVLLRAFLLLSATVR